MIRANLPAHKGATPYAFLEPLRGQLGLPPSQPTTHFSARERTIIMIANALYGRAAGEAGFLRSDQPGSDPFHTLVRMGGNNRPQVDHIRPRTWGGSNSFANAQLVSLKENKSKLAQVTADQAAEALANRHIPPKRAASGDGHAAKRTRYV